MNHVKSTRSMLAQVKVEVKVKKKRVRLYP